MKKHLTDAFARIKASSRRGRLHLHLISISTYIHTYALYLSVPRGPMRAL